MDIFTLCCYINLSLTLPLSCRMDRLPARSCLWAGAELDQFAVQCESAPPQSDDRPDESLLGWDGRLGEIDCSPVTGH